jgi:hypothetical protein
MAVDETTLIARRTELVRDNLNCVLEENTVAATLPADVDNSRVAGRKQQLTPLSGARSGVPAAGTLSVTSPLGMWGGD